MSALKIDVCTIHQLTKAGKYVTNPVLRSDSFSSSTASDLNTVTLDVQFSKTQWQRRLPFFRISFSRTVPFSTEERRALELVVRFFGDYLEEGIQQAHEHACSEKLATLSKLCAHLDDKPGSTVWRFQRILHNALSAHASFLLFVDDDHYLLHYFQDASRNSPEYAKSATPETLGSEFKELCAREDVFLWQLPPHDDPLAKLLRGFLATDNAHWDCLVSVSRYDSCPFAALVFVFSRDFPLFRPLYDEFLTQAATISRIALVTVYAKRVSKMIVKPIFSPRQLSRTSVRAFVLMPFSESWSDRIWNKLLKPIIEACGFVAVRADDLYGRDVMEDVWKGICEARFIVAEITGRNPNVFYELGIAHTIGKPVILLTQRAEDIPFDLNRYRHIIYQDNMDGYEILKAQLQRSIEDVTSTKES